MKNGLSFPEKTSPGAFLKAVRVSDKGTKDSKGEKGRKERIRQQKEEAACRGNGRRRTDKKSPEAFLLQDFC